MTYKQAKARLEKCREEIKKYSRKVSALELEMEGLVKLCELLQRYACQPSEKPIDVYEMNFDTQPDSTPVVPATEETVTQ